MLCPFSPFHARSFSIFQYSQKTKKYPGFFVFGGGAWRGVNEISDMKLVKEIVKKNIAHNVFFFMIEKVFNL